MESTRPFKRVEEVCFYVLYSPRGEPSTVRVNIYARDTHRTTVATYCR